MWWDFFLKWKYCVWHLTTSRILKSQEQGKLLRLVNLSDSHQRVSKITQTGRFCLPFISITFASFLYSLFFFYVIICNYIQTFLMNVIWMIKRYFFCLEDNSNGLEQWEKRGINVRDYLDNLVTIKNVIISHIPYEKWSSLIELKLIKVNLMRFASK